MTWRKAGYQKTARDGTIPLLWTQRELLGATPKLCFDVVLRYVVRTGKPRVVFWSELKRINGQFQQLSKRGLKIAYWSLLCPLHLGRPWCWVCNLTMEAFNSSCIRCSHLSIGSVFCGMLFSQSVGEARQSFLPFKKGRLKDGTCL